MLLDRRLRRIKKAITAWSGKDFYNRDRLPHLLERDFGVEYLGGGCYAHVFALDDKRVLKVIKSVDEGYERFIKKARRSWSPWMPRIHYSGKWGTCRVFVLERLEMNADRSEPLCGAINFMIEHDFNNEWLVCPNQELIKIIEYLQEDDCCNDIHSGNIMWRGEQPVITDPCC